MNDAARDDGAPTTPDSVRDIAIRRDEAVEITFGDGVVAVFPVGELRAACPCAGCRGLRERSEVAWPRGAQAATISVIDAELTGAWGLSIRWSDGHDTGIYAWSVLRRWWDGEMRRPLVDDGPG